MSAADSADDELDRHRRRVLWALPTGLYLIGSRHGDDVNLMTANLVVQVCLEPKLVGVALERESVTAGLVTAGGGFTVSLLARSDRDVVRRFVKPVTDVERAPEGVFLALSGQPVTEVGPDRRPILSCRRWLPRLPPDRQRTPWAATSSASARSSALAASPQRCSAWRTPACTTAVIVQAEGFPPPLGRRPQVDAQREDPVDQLDLGVAHHGVVGEVLLRLLPETLPFGALNRWHPARPYRLGPGPEPGDHLLRVESGHGGQRRGCSLTPSHLVAWSRGHAWDLSTSNSQPGEDGSKPCSISQRAATRLRHDHHARTTSRSMSEP